MSNEILSPSYRAARRNVSLFCAVSIAWATEQFKLTKWPVAGADLDLASPWIHVVLFSAGIYLMTRCSIEYMLQPLSVRRTGLCKFDYRLSFYFLIVTLLLLAASGINRSMEMVFLMLGIMVAAVVLFFLMCWILVMLLSPIILYWRNRKGRVSVVLGVTYATYFGSLITALAFIVATASMGLGLIRPFQWLGLAAQPENAWSIPVFSAQLLIVLFSMFFKTRVTELVFADAPLYIDRWTVDADGRDVFSSIPNPQHPDLQPRSFKRGYYRGGF